MKIIVSHDIDHISFCEHWIRDLFIPKWFAKNFFYGLGGRLTPLLMARRLAAVGQSQFNCVDEVIDVDRKFAIPSTFFVGVSRGMGLSYSLPAAAKMVKRIQANGFPVGVHGMAYNDLEKMHDEFGRLSHILASHEPFGVRNHYLRFTTRTPVLQAQVGYLFDSSDYGLKAPYPVQSLVEFPVCLMDSYLLQDTRNDLSSVKARTLAQLEKGICLNLPCFTIIFHDCYFSSLFPDHREWYLWLVRYLRDNHELTDFVSASQNLTESGFSHA